MGHISVHHIQNIGWSHTVTHTSLYHTTFTCNHAHNTMPHHTTPCHTTPPLTPHHTTPQHVCHDEVAGSVVKGEGEDGGDVWPLPEIPQVYEDVTDLGYEQSLPRRFTFLHVLAVNTVVGGSLIVVNGKCLAADEVVSHGLLDHAGWSVMGS